jgi:hypothetical protein
MTGITGTLREVLCTFMTFLAQFFLERQMFQTKSKHIFLNRAVYVIMWKNMVDPDRKQMAI